MAKWLRRPAGSHGSARQVKLLLRSSGLNSVCEEARCPNIAECFSRRTATFMILGDVCTRRCGFCSIKTGRPYFGQEQFTQEAERLLGAVSSLGLKHVVITSVARDDLRDGGASGFVASTVLLREKLPELVVELLIPDFKGDVNSLKAVISAEPQIINHNLETVPRLYSSVRPQARYRRSLELLSNIKQFAPEIHTKSGIMVGLGERRDEVYQVMSDARAHSVDFFTIGQYMQPTRDHLKVEAYIEPSEFDLYRLHGQSLGFKGVFSGPLVRSSYNAEEFAAGVFEVEQTP